MMDEKRLEQEYKKLKHLQTPDLWNRIEAKLEDHPKRITDGGKDLQKTVHLTKYRIYGIATAAAMLALLVTIPGLMNARREKTARNGTVPTAVAAAPETRADNIRTAETGVTEAASSGGILTYEELQLVNCQPVEIPENALTMAEDTQYFSEDILSETRLLCGATVDSVSLEQDASGKAVKVVYEITLDQVYFSEDYTTGMETLTVKSPIIKTDGDEVYILYQLQPGGTYLLPLQKPERDWELLYPFAPQIQVTGDGAYLFHSGYQSLINEDTSVVIGRPEGSNDYFYDRMVLRRDGNFLSDLLKLVKLVKD